MFIKWNRYVVQELLLTRQSRHLLTHTAGTAYDAVDPNLVKYMSQQGSNASDSPFAGRGTTVPTRFTYPLIFQPGEKWSYGSALDWAGLLVERLTNSTLEEFMKANIWDPPQPSNHDLLPLAKGSANPCPRTVGPRT
jgi:CubicO group peptidase (beta-lactamase class C family)